jgi:L-2-hydroxyglutarate oxidase
VVVIGGGIVGLAITRELATRGMEVTVLEKEGKLARHQTGRNSGVIRAGLYYKPGSLKARLCKEGNHTLVKFAKEHNIVHQITGKLLIANTDGEVDRLQLIAEQAQQTEFPLKLLIRRESESLNLMQLG